MLPNVTVKTFYCSCIITFFYITAIFLPAFLCFSLQRPFSYDSTKPFFPAKNIDVAAISLQQVTKPERAALIVNSYPPTDNTRLAQNKHLCTLKHILYGIKSHILLINYSHINKYFYYSENTKKSLRTTVSRD